MTGHTYLTEGIILKRKPYREHSLLCTCLTEKYGKITLISTGNNKEKSCFTGILEPFNHLNLELYRSSKSEIYNLRNAGFNFGYLRGIDYKTSMLINAAGELIMQVDFTNEDSYDYFQLLNSYCCYLHNPQHHQYYVFIRYILRLFVLLGISMDSNCCRCSSSRLDLYSSSHHGFLCNKCSSDTINNQNTDDNLKAAEMKSDYGKYEVEISAETLAVLENIYNLDKLSGKLITENMIDETLKIFLLHLNMAFHRSFSLKSLKDYKQTVVQQVN